MTDEEREELIETIALQIGRAQFGDWVINPTEKMREQARAALAVAEPVIREQADKALREENARLRELLKPFEEAAGKLDDEPVGVGRQVGFTLKDYRAIRTAIREKRSFATEGGKE